jgi:DNA-directed RNA polymerase specialized sigma24 family protein
LVTEAERLRRIHYVGTLTDLDEYCRDHASMVPRDRILRNILIAELLAEFDEEVRHIVVLRLMGLSWEKVGKELNGRPGTLRERFRVAVLRLRERLSSNGQESEQGGVE